MNILPILFATLALSAGLFFLGRRATGRFRDHPGLLAVFAAAVSIPGLLFVGYYAHLYDHWWWLYELRSWPGAEFFLSGFGFAAGVLSRLQRIVSGGLLAVLALIGATIPFLKPLFRPIGSMQEVHWYEDVCMQSTPATCGPASTATVLRRIGVEATEGELTRECHSCFSGTECWYLARAIRRRGGEVRFSHHEYFPSDLPEVAIAGVRLGEIGHFVALLGEDPVSGKIRVADPASGPLLLSREQFLQRYRFTGFLMTVTSQS